MSDHDDVDTKVGGAPPWANFSPVAPPKSAKQKQEPWANYIPVPEGEAAPPGASKVPERKKAVISCGTCGYEASPIEVYNHKKKEHPQSEE